MKDPGTRRRNFLKQTGGVVTLGFVGCLDESSGDDHDFPTSQFSLIVPWRGGSGVDMVAEALIDPLRDALPNPVDIVVRNVVGGSGQDGIDRIYHADPDGHTVAFVLDGQIMNQLYQYSPIDLLEFSWIARVGASKRVLAVPFNSPFDDIGELLSHDDPLRIATSTATSTLILPFRVLAKRERIQYELFTGNSVSRQISAVREGEADGALLPPIHPQLEPAVESDDIRLLLVYSREPLDSFPGVATLDDVGHPDLEYPGTVQLSVVAPPETDAAIIRILERSILDAVESDGFQRWSEQHFFPVSPGEGNEARRHLQRSKSIYSENTELL